MLRPVCLGSQLREFLVIELRNSVLNLGGIDMGFLQSFFGDRARKEILNFRYVLLPHLGRSDGLGS